MTRGTDDVSVSVTDASTVPPQPLADADAAAALAELPTELPATSGRSERSSADRARAREMFVELSALAEDDPQRARLRETLRVFLAAGGSYTTAADQLTMHKNSVRYRVGRAERERGRPLTEARIDLELALLACRWLGRAVLTPAR